MQCINTVKFHLWSPEFSWGSSSYRQQEFDKLCLSANGGLQFTRESFISEFCLK